MAATSAAVRPGDARAPGSEAAAGEGAELVMPPPPRAVRIIELGEDGAPVYGGLLIVEVGCRLVFNVRPNHKMDMVRAGGRGYGHRRGGVGGAGHPLAKRQC
jgi:hypothetical protein